MGQGFVLAEKPVIPVGTCVDLQNISRDLAASYALTGDIDCSKSTSFKPVASDPKAPFTGVLDGRGFAVKGLSISGDMGLKASGLFGFIEDAVIKDLRLKDIKVYGAQASGALVGQAKHSGIYKIFIENIDIAGRCAGGLAGITDDVRVELVSVAGAVRADHTAGGLIGNGTDTDITDSYSLASVLYQKFLPAMTDNLPVYFGGLMGLRSSFGKASAFKCTFAAGVVQAKGAENMFTGGLVAFQNADAFPLATHASVWDIDATGQASTANGFSMFGLNAQLMRRQSSFAGFDFENTWINDNATYPSLRAEKKARIVYLGKQKDNSGKPVAALRQVPGKVLAFNRNMTLALVPGLKGVLHVGLYVRQGSSWVRVADLVPPDYRVTPGREVSIQYEAAIGKAGAFSVRMSLRSHDPSVELPPPAVYSYKLLPSR
jgi:hypothetical protein